MSRSRWVRLHPRRITLEELETRTVPALVAAYGFEESSGTTATDSSGLGNPGSLAGPARVAGKYGQGLSFNGAGNLVNVADANSLDLTNGMTLEAWVYPTSASDGFDTVILKERGTTSLAYALYAADGAARPPSTYINVGGSDRNATGTSNLPLNTWTHLAATYNGSALRLYVNGTQIATRSQTGNAAVTANALRIGGNTVWGEYFAGRIDEVRVYNSALTQVQIQTDMNTPVVNAPDTTPPTVSVTAPANSATVSGSAVGVSANAADNVGVAGVQFKLDGVNLGAEDTTSPYSIPWDSTAALNGTHQITAVARDAAGNKTTSTVVTVTVSNDTTPPTVSVTAPADNTTVRGAVSVSANASDNVGVVGVQFKLDGVNLGSEDVTSPYAISWDTAAVADGSHVLTGVARDAAGNSTTATAITVTVQNADTTPPVVALTAPADNASVGGLTTVSADASDDVGVVGVQFKLDGILLGTENPTAPYSISWNTTAAANGTHLLTAVARDAAGNKTTSSVVTVTVFNDTTPPDVAVTAPADNSTVDGSIIVSADASDDVGVVGVQFLLDGAARGSESTISPYSIFWDTTSAPNGSHTLSARARDAAGNTTTATVVTVTVVNPDTTPPMVTVTSPADNATVGGSITVSATASDTNGVVGVQFLLNGELLGAEDTAAPYSIGWDTLSTPNGLHQIAAVARDTVGNTSSSSVNVTVFNDTTSPVVSVTSPADNATVMGSIAVSADASDNVGVAGVQFLLDGLNLGAEDTTAPYAVSWNTITTSNGQHHITAVARDAAGNRTTSTAVTVIVSNPDTTPPTVAITAPANGATVSASLSVTGTASDNVGVAGVQFFLDGNPLGSEDTAAPYAAAWNTAASANGTHSLTARARDAAGNIATSAAVAVTVSNSNLVPLAVDGAQTFQTIDGVGVNVNAHSWNNGEVIPALDMLHDQMGATLYRVCYDMVDWESTNDNADPFIPDWAYYNALYSNPDFQELWGTIRYLNQKGVIGSSIVLSFMGRVPPWMGGSVINASAEDEWVETISTLVYYARNTEHVQFSILDPSNEPDWDGIEGPQVSYTQYTRLLHKLSDRLDAMGLGDVRFCGPNTAQISQGVQNYMPALMGDPVVINKIDHYGLHDYTGSTGGADAAIRASAYPTKDFWMTEVTDPVDILSQIGQNASGIAIWDGFDSAYIHPTLHGASMTPPNDASSDPAPLAYDIPTGTYSPRPSFYEDGQIFKFVPSGSVRIGAAESNGNLTLFAFYHQSSGRLTLVARNAGGTNLTVTASLNNLPAATSFEIYKTSGGSNFARLPDVPVANGSMAFLVPANSYITLTTVTIPDATPPTVLVTAPTDGSTVTGTATVSAAANDNVGVAGVQFLLDGNALGAEDTTAPYSVSWGTAATSNGPHTLAARARDASGNTATSVAVSVTVSNIPDTVPPTVSITAPANNAAVSGAVAVTADAFDNVGVVGVQFLVDGANLGAEDTVAPYSVSWGTVGISNGLHTLTARARDAAGNNTTSATVSVTVNNTSNPGLVAAYGFEEGTGGTAGNSTTNGLNGTISGATWVTTGKYGKALSFNGTSAVVTVADAAVLHLTTGMTLEAWVRPAVTSTDWSTALLKERPGGLAYALYAFDGANKPPAGYVNVGGSDRNATATSNLSLDAWTHLAATYDGVALRLFVNGVQTASRSQSGSITSSTSPLRIGGNTVWGEYFNGLIDEVRIYNRALSQSEIQTDMNTPVGGGGGGLRLAGEPGASGTAPILLTRAELEPLVAAAIARWTDTGGPSVVGTLADVPVRLADLPGTELGFTSAGTVWIDRDAAGYGWFVDPTPHDDVEFPAGPTSIAFGKPDLLTVVTHELGHVLGLEHDDGPVGDHLMDAALSLETRRMPDAHELPAPNLPIPAAESTSPVISFEPASSESESEIGDPSALAGASSDSSWVAMNPWDNDFLTDGRRKPRGYLLDQQRPPEPASLSVADRGPLSPPQRPQD